MRERKTGKQILDDFFASLQEHPDINQDAVKLLILLHHKGKINANEIERGLEELRKELFDEA